MTQLMRQLIDSLRSVPEAEQDDVAGPFIEVLNSRQGSADREDRPYVSFELLSEADLDLDPDYSQTYEHALYGRDDDLA